MSKYSNVFFMRLVMFKYFDVFVRRLVRYDSDSEIMV